MMINVLNGTLDIGIGEIQELRSQLEAEQDPPARHLQPGAHDRLSRTCRR